jgi:hypothetical protein
MKVVSLILSVYSVSARALWHKVRVVAQPDRPPVQVARPPAPHCRTEAPSAGREDQRVPILQTPSITARQEIIWAPRRQAPFPMQRLTATL